MFSTITQTLSQHTKGTLQTLCRKSPPIFTAIETFTNQSGQKPCSSTHTIESSLNDLKQKENAQNTDLFIKKLAFQKTNSPSTSQEHRTFNEITHSLKRAIFYPHILMNEKVSFTYPLDHFKDSTVTNTLKALQNSGFDVSYTESKEVSSFTISLIEKYKEEREILKKQLFTIAHQYILTKVENPDCPHTRFLIPQEYIPLVDDLLDLLQKEGFDLNEYQHPSTDSKIALVKHLKKEGLYCPRISDIEILFTNPLLETPGDEPTHLKDYKLSPLPSIEWACTSSAFQKIQNKSNS